MTGSIDEVRAGLVAVLELLDEAGGRLTRAAGLIDEAVAVLAQLGREGGLPLPPRELRRAVDEAQRVRAAIQGGLTVVDGIQARL